MSKAWGNGKEFMPDKPFECALEIRSDSSLRENIKFRVSSVKIDEGRFEFRAQMVEK
jgi:hypothetical protein